EELAEPAVERVELFLLTLVPLADQGGRVAGGLKAGGDRRLGDRQALAGAAEGDDGRVELVAEPLLVSAGEEPGPRRRADRAGDVTALAANAGIREGVEVRRGHLRAAVEADVAIAEVVGEEDDDVRAVGGGRI